MVDFELGVDVGFEEAQTHPPGPPPLAAAVNPALLPPLCDVRTEQAVFVWYKLVYDGTSDLDPEPCDEDSIGGWPDWYVQEDDTSLDTILSPDWTRAMYEGHEFTDKWIQWALREGIAPGQPFLLRIDKPVYSYSYWDNECDVEWSIEVVRVMPRTPRQALRAWAPIQQNIRRYYDLFLKRLDRLHRLQDTDSSVWSLVTEPYYAERYHDEMSPPGGLRLFLCSLHGSMWGVSKGRHPHRLISGEDNEGDFRKAFRNLLRNIRKDRPRIDIAAVVGLTAGRAEITRWEHMSLGMDAPEAV